MDGAAIKYKGSLVNCVKKYYHPLLLWLALALVVFGCGYDYSQSTEVYSSRHLWINRLLDSPTCKLPCWENIDPGVTTITDAYLLLQQLPNLKITYKNQDGIDWELDGTDYGTATSINGDGIVTVIAIKIDSAQNLLLSEFVESYGFPTFVNLNRCEQGNCAVRLVYPKLGVYLELFLPSSGKNEQIILDAEVPVHRIMFYPAGSENYTKLPTIYNSELIEWKGYDTYP